MISKDHEWIWQDTHTTEFNLLKECITRALVLAYYGQNRPIILSVNFL